MKDELIRYARAGYAGLFLCTPEEVRAEAVIKAAADELERPLHAWSVTTGFVDTASGSVRDCPDPVQALESIEALEGDCVILLRDFGLFLEEKDPLLIRKLRDTLREAKSSGKLIVLLGVTENPVHVHDFHATCLHLLGIDHEHLTHRHQGRDFRLTDVHGHMVHDIVS